MTISFLEWYFWLSLFSCSLSEYLNSMKSTNTLLSDITQTQSDFKDLQLSPYYK